jgi:hypothetical protein
MLRLARTGYSSRVLESAEIDSLGERPVAGVTGQ